MSPQIYVCFVQQPGTNWRVPPDPLYIYHILLPRPHAGGNFVRGLIAGGQLYPASSNWDIADVPYIFRRRNSPDISAQVQQPSLLNIDMHSTIPEQQVQTSNIISTDKYNPVRVTHQYMWTPQMLHMYCDTIMAVNTFNITLMRCMYFPTNVSIFYPKELSVATTFIASENHWTNYIFTSHINRFKSNIYWKSSATRQWGISSYRMRSWTRKCK